jgi:hypothetical protein
LLQRLPRRQQILSWEQVLAGQFGPQSDEPAGMIRQLADAAGMSEPAVEPSAAISRQ